MCTTIGNFKEDPKLQAYADNIIAVKQRFLEKMKFAEKTVKGAAETLNKENRAAWEPLEAYLKESGALSKDYNPDSQVITLDGKTGEIEMHERSADMEEFKEQLMGMLEGLVKKRRGGKPGQTIQDLMSQFDSDVPPVFH